MQNLAEVRLWQQQVGALVFDPKTRTALFEYSPEWLAKGVEIAPIHMPLSRGKFQFPGLNPDTYKGLPAVFADTLPDDFGNAVINAWLARNGRSSESFSPLERLLYSGQRGMGALEYAPAIRAGQDAPQSSLELSSLVAMAQAVLDQRANLDVSLSPALQKQDSQSMSAILQVGTSAGGARPKAVIAINRERTEIRSGQLDAPEGFEHYLLKFDGVEEHKVDSEVFGDPQGFGRMEYAYYLMACDAGLNMSPSELLMEGKRAHFMTRRFDREGNRKLHYSSLCAMDHADYKRPGSYSYEEMLTLARRLRLPREDAVEIFRRMVFNVVARNHDDHSKNFGFILASPNDAWRLAPAFDVAYSYKADSPWVNSHQLSLNGKRDSFEHEDLLAIASLIGNFRQEAKRIIAQVTEVVSEWAHYAETADVFEGFKEEINNNLRLNLT
ncbi:type II toxin-antitoxin system HipA family toxin [Aestuariicella sp. G3-2]|uniref:type II toxin-antitoxin system HipA family toxin n=1 Tax=Pseudomaricurvus albidus TaxID=2842452 RepID=UPI001C0B7778|nr:type II toxin-antitoxin system HipA family toxin [Aestuariicella albida]MBU3071209.1 type II toxin-antitoxin system HipA family toxin [Aestuariicella albida]